MALCMSAVRRSDLASILLAPPLRLGWNPSHGSSPWFPSQRWLLAVPNWCHSPLPRWWGWHSAETGGWRCRCRHHCPTGHPSKGYHGCPIVYPSYGICPWYPWWYVRQVLCRRYLPRICNWSMASLWMTLAMAMMKSSARPVDIIVSMMTFT